MQLDLLPHRTAGAAENMAADFLLLQRYPEPAHARFRHYDWRGPAFTFGYGQKIAYVRDQLAALAPGEHPDLTRRPTGGGVVDHRNDWTFALVIPRGHGDKLDLDHIITGLLCIDHPDRILGTMN